MTFVKSLNLKTGLILSILISAILTNKNTSNDILGENSSDGTISKGAITYALASNEAYKLQDETVKNIIYFSKGYKSPQYLNRLPAKFELPQPGPIESIDETPSTANYYDGSNNLNVFKIQCKLSGNVGDCLKQSSCGWCGSTNSCILGNNLGPLQPCKKSSYLFSVPLPNWNPQTRVVNEEVGGVSLTVVSK